MYARTSILQPIIGLQQQFRGMATLKAISIRLKSVKNIQKITQSMKMVSAAKYARAERELRQARPYGEGSTSFYENLFKEAATSTLGESHNTKTEPTEGKRLIVACTSDRGLCGAVHTTVARQIRNELNVKSDDVQVVCIGDKSRAILQRLYGKNIILVANEVGRKPPTFLDAARIAEQIAKSDYTSGKIVYNRFKSVVSYTTSELPLYHRDTVAASPNIHLYDSLDENVLQSYMEFSLASLLYFTMKESACSEQSSRMTAMDNASKNAGEMIDKLTLTFNRTRQAVITRELIEIISGASALS